MADAAIRIVKFLAEFALALFDVATGAIASENSLSVRLGGSYIFCTVNTRHIIGKRRVNGDFNGERLGIFVSADGDGFGKRPALGCDVDLDPNLAVCAGRNDPRQRRQLCRRAAARWPD